jgi:hypothetical protein
MWVLAMKQNYVTVIEPNICGYLLLNWLHVTVIEPNICGYLLWNWINVTLESLMFVGTFYGTGFMSRL